MTLIEYLTANPAVLAAVCTVAGALVLKTLEHFLNRDNGKRADRKEFREEWNELLGRIDRLEAEVDAWRDKYYRGQEEILTLKAMIIGAGIKIPDDVRSITDE